MDTQHKKCKQLYQNHKMWGKDRGIKLSYQFIKDCKMFWVNLQASTKQTSSR
jgi:hypothetical protein